MRFTLTAQTLARDRALNRRSTDYTRANIAKVTKFRSAADATDSANIIVDEGGDMRVLEADEIEAARRKRAHQELEGMVNQFRAMETSGQKGRKLPKKEGVYPVRSQSYYQGKGSRISADTGAGGSAGMNVGRI